MTIERNCATNWHFPEEHVYHKRSRAQHAQSAALAALAARIVGMPPKPRVRLKRTLMKLTIVATAAQRAEVVLALALDAS